MAKKKTSSSRYADQAALQSLVRFGPQLDVLKEAQRTAEGTYQQRVQQAQSGAQAVIGAVDQSAPQMAQIYDRAGLDQARTSNTLIGHDLAGLSGVADSIKGGAALEAAGMAGRLGEARAASLGDLQNRKVGAAAGEVAAGRAAGDELVANLTKILQSKKDIAGQSGAFKAATIGDLQQAARDRALKVSLNNQDNSQSERNSVRTSGIDPDTGQPIPGGKLDPKAKKGLTATGAKAVSPDAHLAFQNKVQEIGSYADKYKGKLSRSQIVEKLKKGRPPSSGYANPKTGLPVAKGTPGAVPYSLTKVPQYPADLAMTAALDVALDGHLSRKTQRALQQHYVIGDLGLPTYAEWRKKNRPASRGTQRTASKGIDVVNALVQSLGG